MLAWFICPYKRKDRRNMPTRYCAMDDFTPQILADGGAWAETEVLGNVALVKVRASETTLNTIAGTTGYVRILDRFVLSDPLTNLTTQQRNAIINKLTSMGYTTTEINAAMGSTLAEWRTHTLLDLLNLIATRRLKPRYDAGTDTIILDGPVQVVLPVTVVDNQVQ